MPSSIIIDRFLDSQRLEGILRQTKLWSRDGRKIYKFDFWPSPASANRTSPARNWTGNMKNACSNTLDRTWRTCFGPEKNGKVLINRILPLLCSTLPQAGPLESGPLVLEHKPRSPRSGHLNKQHEFFSGMGNDSNETNQYRPTTLFLGPSPRVSQLNRQAASQSISHSKTNTETISLNKHRVDWPKNTEKLVPSLEDSRTLVLLGTRILISIN